MRGFDAILIATGASALVPGPLRRGGGDFFLMRTLNDAQRLRRRLEQGGVKRAVVVGGSMVGIKVAELLYRRGVEVTLADEFTGLTVVLRYVVYPACDVITRNVRVINATGAPVRRYPTNQACVVPSPTSAVPLLAQRSSPGNRSRP